MKWDLAIVALIVLAVAAASSRLSGTSVTPAMVFVALGLLVGPLVADDFKLAPGSSAVRTLAEATLAIVLFLDASRIKLDALRREYAVPLRLLGIGLPLTIALGAVAAVLLFPHLTVAEALVLAVLLAPTDAALGEAVVTEPRLPSRIRQGLNVESGLNDGICVPVLLIVLAAADVEFKASAAHGALRIVVEEIGYGIVAGVAAGVLVAAIVMVGSRRRLIAGSWLQVIPVAGAALAYGVAVALGGSGFIAAFVAGAFFGGLVGSESEAASRFGEEIGELMGGVGFLGWFGPRGLASIVFAVIVVQEASLPGTNTILVATYVTVGVSVMAHGITAAPLARWYANWYEAHPTHRRPAMESVPAAAHRTRGNRAPDATHEPRSITRFG
jgi:NhaP-type Na+/H+ or K+/H+ antiporter